jgi:hypothetical protein
MKTDYKFWEQNVNPITMMPDDKKNYSSYWDLDEMDKSQKKQEALEERRAVRREEARIKRMGKW